MERICADRSGTNGRCCNAYTDDELLADSAAELDQRALDKVRAFVNTLAENEALCTLQSGGKTFQYADITQVRRSLARISQDNLHEVGRVKVTRIGLLLRRLPSSQIFTVLPLVYGFCKP